MIIAVHVASVRTEAVEGGEVIEIKIGKLEMTRINKATIIKKSIPCITLVAQVRNAEEQVRSLRLPALGFCTNE